MSRFRVLFVDDDPHVLAGLRRLLRTERRAWEMEFVESGAAALERLAERPYDVIVSDMRMPEMDGAELLARVRDRWPRVTRIILSGHSDQEMILRSIGTTHQFLAKPCNPDDLKDAIRRTERLRRLVHREEVQRIVARARNLPSMPDLFRALMDELRKPQASLQRIGEIIARDPVMTAQILRIVNSAFFGLASNITNPGQAVNYLGLSTVTSLVLTVHVFQQAPRELLERTGLRHLWRHSLRTAVFAREIATLEQLPPHQRDELFTAGLLHDVGRLLLAVNLTDDYRAMADRFEGRPVVEAERETFGAGHPEIGAYLLGIWGLPNSIVEAVAWHDAPRATGESGPSPALWVQVVNAIEHLLCPRAEKFAAPALDLELLEEAGFAGRLGPWKEACRAMLEESEREESPA